MMIIIIYLIAVAFALPQSKAIGSTRRLLNNNAPAKCSRAKGWALPHQRPGECHCCAQGTSCNRCPNGWKVSNRLCAGRGNRICKAIPTNKPTPSPTLKPTPKPTEKPTLKPTSKPTEKPTSKPTSKPTEKPTLKPTSKPTEKPTLKPTSKPTEKPTSKPTSKPTEKPTLKPTSKPTEKPTSKPTSKPTEKPTSKPTTSKPSEEPTLKPTTSRPTLLPTFSETSNFPTPALDFSWSGLVPECFGADIEYVNGVNSLQECQRFCENNPQCKFITWGLNQCWLKNGLISVHFCEDCSDNGTCDQTGTCDPSTQYCSSNVFRGVITIVPRWSGCDEDTICENGTYCRVGDHRCLTDEDCEYVNHVDSPRDCTRFGLENLDPTFDPTSDPTSLYEDATTDAPSEYY